VKSTHFAKTGEVERKWVLIDADGATLGRLATQVAMILRGKNKPQFTPNADTGDYVVVINASKVQLTGNKAEKKQYLMTHVKPLS
jgi:large subunit ribosomal protein L13